jgi:pyruvate-formate lyase-activating enzyme
MIHLDFIHALAKELFKKKISLAIDTSGATFIEKNIKTYKKICKYNPL